MTLSLDLAFISKTNKPVTDQGPEETQAPSNQEETSLITETTGSSTGQCISHSTVNIICMY